MTEDRKIEEEARPAKGRASSLLALAKPLGITAALLVALYVVKQDRISALTGDESSVLVQALVTGVLLGGVYALVSMGLTLIFGVLNIINFAHGALLTVGMYCSFVIGSNAGIDPYLTMILTVPMLFLIGAAIQVVMIKKAMGQPHENQLLITLGLSMLIQNALLFAFGATPKVVHTSLAADVTLFGASLSLPRIIAFVGALGIAALLYLMLHRTKLGTAIRAVADNSTGGALVGINADRIYAITFGLGTACVGAAAVLVLPFMNLEPTTGEQFNIIAFVVVVLGGLGSVGGALTGGFLIGVVQELGGVLFPNQSKLLLVLLVFVAVLLFRPQGLFKGRV